MITTPLPLVLIILDGWGYRSETDANAIAAAHTPHWDRLWQNNPHLLISGSGIGVGLPEGQMGNSEVGHLNIGAGRIIYQEYSRIEEAIANRTFFSNPVLLKAINQATTTNKSIHIMGLLSPGGVHSHEHHIHTMLALAAKQQAKNVYLHVFLDGRDTPPRSAKASLETLMKKIQALSCGKIATIIGRYYAMDRDQRWERIESAYELLTGVPADHSQSIYHAESPLEGLEKAYERGETDEFVKATYIHGPQEQPVTIQDGDVVIFMNYRADRARQLTHAFTDKDFTGFSRYAVPNLADFVTLTHYASNIHAHIGFPPEQPKNVLGACLANAGLKQLRIAETEKYAHVTFFFNGGIEQPFPGEERILIPSAKVATYDLKPEMSAPEITDQLITAIKSKDYALLVCNYANADMVGHSGNFAATVKAVETIDTCIGRLVKTLQEVGGEMIVTADHGNAEKMFDKNTQQPHTAHTHEPVPFVYCGRPATITVTKDGALADIAPTILYLMALKQPAEMTGKPLLALA